MLSSLYKIIYFSVTYHEIDNVQILTSQSIRQLAQKIDKVFVDHIK